VAARRNTTTEVESTIEQVFLVPGTGIRTRTTLRSEGFKPTRLRPLASSPFDRVLLSGVSSVPSSARVQPLTGCGKTTCPANRRLIYQALWCRDPARNSVLQHPATDSSSQVRDY